MKKPQMTLPNGDVLYEGDYAVTREGQKVGPLRPYGTLSHKWNVPHFEGADSEFFNDNGLSDEPSANHLVAKWVDEDIPVLWGYMTPEQKGALLLAHHEGKEIEAYGIATHWQWQVMAEGPHWYDCCSYRIKPSKPEPKVETVGLHWHATHRITFNLIDGKPDCDSVKMMPINE